MDKKPDLKVGRAVPASGSDKNSRPWAPPTGHVATPKIVPSWPSEHVCIHNRTVHVVRATDETLFFLACDCGDVAIKLEDKKKDDA